jgi:hypothetical protein
MFLCYASPKGSALIDRRLYLPKSWAENPQRCQKAGVPTEVRFFTKPQLARQMLQRFTHPCRSNGRRLILFMTVTAVRECGWKMRDKPMF